MTDKQVYRDKLALPTASINVFLTSLTHVGLANIGKLMLLSGHLPYKPSDNDNWKASPGGGVVARVDGVSGWRVIGRRLAFKEDIIKRSELTEEIEDEVVEYVKYLVAGGQPGHFTTAEGGEGAGGKYAIIKTIKTRPRSRSKSRGPLGIGKDSRTGRMYVVRKKSMSLPSTETFEYVEREYDGRPEEKMHKRYLALPAPPAPGFMDSHDYRQPRYVERRPSGISSDGSDDSDSDPGAERYQRFSEDRESRKEKKESETAERWRDTTDARGADRPSRHTYSARERNDRSRLLRQKIEDEKQQAIEEIERKTRASRRRERESGFVVNEYEAKQRKETAKDDEINETIKFLESEYGVIVTPLPVEREPIDNGRVRSVESPSGASDFERGSFSDSDESDSPILPGMSRTDRLRAETSLPEYSAPARGRRYESRRRYEPSRYRSYSPYDRERFRRSRHSSPDHDHHSPPRPKLYDEKYRTRTHHAPPTPLTPSMFDDGHGSRRYQDRARHDHDHYHDHQHHDGGEYFRPPPTTLTEEEIYLLRKANEDRRRHSTRSIIVVQDDADPSSGLGRRASHGGADARREQNVHVHETRRYEDEDGHEQHDTYMSGGLGPHGSEHEPEDPM
jgi:hypothetical protein